MTEFYKPYPKEIYTINRLLPEKYFFVSFNYINRCYEYVYVHPKKRRFDKTIFDNKNMPHFFKNKNNWNDFEGYIDRYFQKDKNIKNLFEGLKQDVSNEDYKVNIHYYLLKIFNSYPVNPRKCSDGILKKMAKYCAKYQDNTGQIKFKSSGNGVIDVRFKYAEVDLLTEHKFKEFPWIKLKFYDTEGKCIKIKAEEGWSKNIIVSQDQENPEFYKEYRNDAPSSNSSTKNKFFYNYLWFFWSFKDSKGDSYLDDTDREDLIKTMKASFVVPVYSAGLRDGDYGTIVGHLYCPFESQEERGGNKERVERLWYTWAPLAAQAILNDREYELIAQPLKYGDDILKDFLSKITYIQDWERAAVFRCINKRYELQYCFKRYPGNEKDRLEYEEIWDICEAGGENCNECYTKYMNSDNSTGGKEVTGKCYFRWDINDILDPLVLPSIDNENIARYKDHVVWFEFPEYTFFPPQKDKNEPITEVGKHYVNKLIPIFDKLLLKYKILKHSIKAAISAIISRNHSHHIGSHVTPRTSVKDIEKRLGDKELGCRLNEGDLLKVIGNLKSRLDKYIQKKADFMAEIATEPLTTTISKSFFREVLLYFIQNTLLTDNIGANEGVNYKLQDGRSENRLKIHFLFKGQEFTADFKGNCINCDRTFDHMTLPYTGLCDCNSPEELYLSNPKGKDVTIAWPGPLGEFSFYCFLENFIRNAIKHNYEKLRNNGPLNVYVSVGELDEDDSEKHEFYKIEVWEDVTDPCKPIPVAIDGKSETTTLKKHLAGLIHSEIVDNQGRLKKGAWGIAEMKIMATLMRGSDNFISMNSNLSVGCCKKDGKERLIYEFRIMKPKEIAIIAKTSPEDDKSIQHRDQGVWWFDSFGKLKNHQTHGLSPATFNIVVIDKAVYNDEEKNIKKHSHLLPYRIIVADQHKTLCECDDLPGAIRGKIECNELKEKDANDIISGCWDEWVAGLMKRNGYENPRVDLFLQQKMKDTPTSEWKERAKEWDNNDNSLKLSIISTENRIIPAVENSENHFIYDRHFRGIGILNTPANFENNPPMFHEAFDKCSSDFVPIFASSPTPQMIYQLAEAASLRILIIDERVAEVAYKEMSIEIDAKDYYKIQNRMRLNIAKWSNIFIATHLKINDKSTAYDVHHSTQNKSPRVCVKCKTFSDINVETSRVNEFKVYWCNGNDCGECNSAKEIEPQPNALIMHQGVAESLLKDAILINNKAETFVEALTAFLNGLKKHIPYIVIDSGRGIPANLPQTAKFLPFSLIEDYLMKDRMAKFTLTRVLMNIMRRGK